MKSKKGTKPRGIFVRGARNNNQCLDVSCWIIKLSTEFSSIAPPSPILWCANFRETFFYTMKSMKGTKPRGIFVRGARNTNQCQDVSWWIMKLSTEFSSIAPPSPILWCANFRETFFIQWKAWKEQSHVEYLCVEQETLISVRMFLDE
jgi:hypothetical protein